MIKIKYKLLTIILAFLFYSCNKELSNDEKFIESLSNDVDFNLPLHNESLKILIDKNDTVYSTSLRQLYEINNRNYKDYKDFDSFLIKAINEDLLSKSDLLKNSEYSFTLSEKLLHNYDNKGLDYLIKTYCEKSNSKNKYYIISGLSLNEKQSLMFFFFKNNYYVMQNDDSGKYVLINKNL
ncbi:hypothetical protein [Flavobacterium reichenbachii]|uniref:Lipoprotein n=1 Tax=Flavobacterium reichenbachii TaxID=362418 RepID=A0A085ZDV9_9FLAO|nr:hypothetical protein [Flavobacterium reichenbachii]KFF02623.1 hypothetical protein IW19_23440 [Flavobacterium reichenbachii]OXB11120.1 hypothetical protein B0A68_21075 [Flavobacterium reichenbachii]